MIDDQTQVRLTVDIPQKYHRELKARAVIQGKTLRQLVMELILENLGSSDSTNSKFSPEEKALWNKIQKQTTEIGQASGQRNLSDLSEDEKMQLALNA